MESELSETGKDTTRFKFGEALGFLSDGHRVSRISWNGPGQWIKMQAPDVNSKMTLPYLYIKTVQGDLVPWLASQSDILSADWYVLPEAAAAVPQDADVA